MNILEILEKYKSAFLLGISVTLKLCLVIWGLGIFIGLILGVFAYRIKSINFLIKAINFGLSSMPVLVLLFWLHYPLQAILGIVINPFITTAFTLTLINIFGVSNIVCSNLNEIPNEYREVAKVCNISEYSIFSKIEFPMMLRLALPTILVLQVNMLHLTLFGSLISVEEIFRICQQINSQIYQPIEVYSTLALFFLIISLPLNGFAIYLKIKLSNYQTTSTR